MSIKDKGVWMDFAENSVNLSSLEDVRYNLFSDLIGENLSPAQCEKKYMLPISKLRQIIHKDSTVTTEQYQKWIKQ